MNLGLIPSSEDGWRVACAALCDQGGVLHVHGCVDSPLTVNPEPNSTHSTEQVNKHSDVPKSERWAKRKPCRDEWKFWAAHVTTELSSILQEIHAAQWKCIVVHIEHVKQYAPHINHVVADIECRPEV